MLTTRPLYDGSLRRRLRRGRSGGSLDHETVKALSAKVAKLGGRGVRGSRVSRLRVTLRVRGPALRVAAWVRGPGVTVRAGLTIPAHPDMRYFVRRSG